MKRKVIVRERAKNPKDVVRGGKVYRVLKPRARRFGIYVLKPDGVTRDFRSLNYPKAYKSKLIGQRFLETVRRLYRRVVR